MNSLKTLVALVSIVILAFVLWPQQGEKPAVEGPYTLPLTLELADEPAEQELGLSNRESMPRDRGMLFAFPAPALTGIWMKDMRFSIDVIWIDEGKTIVKIDRSVSPDTYPKIFRTEELVKYVLEVNSGVARSLGLEIGQRLDFGLVLE
jgi:uncharacterized membrane protein (UPF0127 family)